MRPLLVLFTVFVRYCVLLFIFHLLFRPCTASQERKNYGAIFISLLYLGQFLLYLCLLHVFLQFLSF